MSSWSTQFYQDVIRDREWVTFGEPLDVGGLPQSVKPLGGDENANEEVLCRIDLTPLIDAEWISRLDCNQKTHHFYHTNSLERWTKLSHSQKCPVCTLPRQETRFDRRRIVVLDQGQHKTVDNDQWKELLEKEGNCPHLVSVGYCHTSLYRELREPYLSIMNNYFVRAFVSLPINLMQWVAFAVTWVALKTFSSLSVSTWCHVASISLALGTGAYFVLKGVQTGAWWAVFFGLGASSQKLFAIGGGLFGTCLGIVTAMVLCDYLELGERLARALPPEILTDSLIQSLHPELTPFQILRGELARREIVV